MKSPSGITDRSNCPHCKQPYGWINRIRVCWKCNYWPEGDPQ